MAIWIPMLIGAGLGAGIGAAVTPKEEPKWKGAVAGLVVGATAGAGIGGAAAPAGGAGAGTGGTTAVATTTPQILGGGGASAIEGSTLAGVQPFVGSGTVLAEGGVSAATAAPWYAANPGATGLESIAGSFGTAVADNPLIAGGLSIAASDTLVNSGDNDPGDEYGPSYDGGVSWEDSGYVSSELPSYVDGNIYYDDLRNPRGYGRSYFNNSYFV